ncbi:MAG: YhjD/YihY/BrkB family envelope integrity protein [Phycisphaerales bacterium]|nr:YhjD/YihY/BrkB family envelope integrity protein [Phycisphaerales bacterium]
MSDRGQSEGLGHFIKRWTGAVGEWLGHRAIPPMAAALAYRTVFSIIPIFIIGLVVLQRFINKQSVVDDLFGRIMSWLGVSQISVNADEAMKIDSVLRQLAGSLDKLSFTGIGIISGLTLIYAAISLLIELENSFNRLYNAPQGRSFVRRVMQYWLLISLGPVLLAGSFFIAEQVTGMTGAVDGAGWSGGWLLKTAGFLSSVAISTLALWLLYITVPNARVRALPALQGAVVGAIALEAAKYGFQVYLERAALKSLYGSMALIPLFLLWVYMTWIVVLTGLRVSYLIQNGRRVTLLHLASGKRGSAFIDPSYALAVACDVAAAFATGKSCGVEEVGERVGMTDQAARQMLERLATDGVLAELQTGGAERRERWVLARPAEKIAVSTVLESGFAAVGSAVPPQVTAMRAAQVAASQGRTLADELEATNAEPAAQSTAVLAGEDEVPLAPPSRQADGLGGA